MLVDIMGDFDGMSASLGLFNALRFKMPDIVRLYSYFCIAYGLLLLTHSYILYQYQLEYEGCAI